MKKERELMVVNSSKVGKSVMNFMKKANSKEMVELFVSHGLISSKEAGNYGDAVCDLCDNGVAYILAKMIEQLSMHILEDILVVRGKYDSFPHTWIEIKDINIGIDPTLAQFEDDVPDIAIVNLSYSSNYVSNVTISAPEWLSEVSGVDIDMEPTKEDRETIDAIVEKSEEKWGDLQIGNGVYTFDAEPTALELFLYIFEERDIQLDCEADEGTVPEMEYQDLKSSLANAIEDISIEVENENKGYNKEANHA